MVEPRDIVLIFDLDNTLIHSTIDFQGVRHRLIDLLEARGAVHAPREELLRYAIPQLVDLGESADAELGRQMWKVVAAAEEAGLKDARADDQAAGVLAALRARGHRLAVLTNNARVGVIAKLEEFALTPFFDVIVTRDDVKAMKPSAAGIHHILSSLPGVRGAWLIGDAWIDGLAAREAAIPFVGIGARRQVAMERGAQPREWVTQLRELLDLDFTRGV